MPLVTGEGNDTGIDSIAIIVNNNIVTDVGAIEDLLAVNGYLDVTFVFVQAERAPHFDSAKIGTFGFGVRDFFGEGKLPCNDTIQQYADIMSAIYENSSKFRPNRPSCYLYYVTTGTWNSDPPLVVRAETELSDLRRTQLFEKVEFIPIGADQINKLYQQSKNAITREFVSFWPVVQYRHDHSQIRSLRYSQAQRPYRSSIFFTTSRCISGSTCV